MYYVKETGEKEDYIVDIETKTGYAIFKTTHFSIYILGYKETTTKVKVTFDANGGKFDKSDTYVIDNCKAEMYDDLKSPTREGYKFKG